MPNEASNRLDQLARTEYSVRGSIWTLEARPLLQHLLLTHVVGWIGLSLDSAWKDLPTVPSWTYALAQQAAKSPSKANFAKACLTLAKAAPAMNSGANLIKLLLVRSLLSPFAALAYSLLSS